MPMTDAELEVFLGITGEPNAAKFIMALSLEKRALFGRMANLEIEVALWQDGLGPKPTGVIICGCGKRGRHRHGRQRCE